MAVTLPTDVVAWLENLDADVGRAIVRLHDDALHRDRQAPRLDPPAAEIVDVGDGRGLIVVKPGLVRGLAGVAVIAIGEGRAFLALEPSWTMADLELAVVDALQRGVADARRRRELAEFRELLRSWRTDQTMTLEPRAIIVVGKRTERKRDRRR